MIVEEIRMVDALNIEVKELMDRTYHDEKTLREITAQNCVLNEENSELKKQVDELTEQLKKLKLAHTSFCEECADYCPRVPQAIKNTAHEIFAELFYIASIHHSDVASILAWAKEKARNCGVEVV